MWNESELSLTLMLLAAEPIARKYSGNTMVIISRAVAIFSLTMLRKYPEGKCFGDTSYQPLEDLQDLEGENVCDIQSRMGGASGLGISPWRWAWLDGPGTEAGSDSHDFEWMSKLCAMALPNASVPSWPMPSLSTQLIAPAAGMAPAPRPTL